MCSSDLRVSVIAWIRRLRDRGGLGSAGERHGSFASDLQKGQGHEVGSISHGDPQNGEPVAKIKNQGARFMKNG